MRWMVSKLGTQSQELIHSFVDSTSMIDAPTELVVGLDHPQCRVPTKAFGQMSHSVACFLIDVDKMPLEKMFRVHI